MSALQKEIITRPLASFLLLLLKKYSYIFLFLLVVTLVSGCESSNSEIIYSGSVMGTTYEVKIISSKRITPAMNKLIDTKKEEKKANDKLNKNIKPPSKVRVRK